MTYIEKRRYKDETYALLTHKFVLLGKSYRISLNVGRFHSKLNLRNLILDNFEELESKIFNIRKILLPKVQYKGNQLEKLEKLSIRLNLLIEANNNSEIIMTEFAKEFIFNSNNIEGSKIPKEEVQKILDFGDTSYFNHNEVKEVFNSIVSMQYIEKGFFFNIKSIKRLYYILTDGLTRENNLSYPKGFKTKKIVVNNQSTIAPEKVEKELIKLFNYYKDNKNNLHPLILSFNVHAYYENIHPFTDANGRTGRFIMNKVLINSAYFPIIIFKENTKKYHNSLKSFIVDGKTNKYYEFMIEQMFKTYEMFIDYFK